MLRVLSPTSKPVFQQIKVAAGYLKSSNTAAESLSSHAYYSWRFFLMNIKYIHIH